MGKESKQAKAGGVCWWGGRLPIYRRFLFHLAHTSDFLKASKEVSRIRAEILLRVCLVWDGGWMWGGGVWVILMGGRRPIIPSVRL